MGKKQKGESVKISVIGTGYVGLVTGACLADMGNDVICVDNNPEKLKKLEQGLIPIFEPGLEELIKHNTKENRLSFSSNIKEAVEFSDICFITVGTPQDKDGNADLQYVMNVAEDISKYLNGYKVIVNKSTVPVGTAEKITDIIKTNTNHPFDVVANPEFLKQGNAVEDFLYPDRIIIGSESDKATKIMKDLYTSFFRTNNRIMVMDIKSAELAKYASNSFLATKISFMNEIANLCEKVGADVEMVRMGITADSRIGNKFLFPGLGYGGSCFPKDLKALIKTGEKYGYDMPIIKSVDYTNKMQREIFTKKIFKRFGDNLTGKTFAVWGLAFKPKTDDVREAPAITIIKKLIDAGAVVKAYDPKAKENAAKILTKGVSFADTLYDVFDGADAMLLMTEWNEFRHPDFNRIKQLMKTPIIFDGRNLYNAEFLKEQSFECYQVGR